MTPQVEPRVNGGAGESLPSNGRAVLDSIVSEGKCGSDRERLKLEEDRFSFQQRRAKLFAASGLFAIKDLPPDQAIAQAMVRIELGESMGFTPAESLQGIHVINGQTAVSSALRAARMQAAGYDWDIDWLGPEDDCTGCRLWLYRNGKPLVKARHNERGEVILDQNGVPVMEHVSVSFKKADAAKMLTTLWENNQKRRASILEKDNWKMSPRNMYFARCVTNAQRFHAPKVLSINLLSTEEAMDLDPEQDRLNRASINLSQIRPSVDVNRGHGGANPVVAKPAAAPAPTADHPPTFIEDLSEWPENPDLPWLKVQGVVYRQAEKGYEKWEAPVKNGRK